MLFRFSYNHYKSGEGVFIGTQEEWDNHVGRQGGVWDLLSKTVTTDSRDVEHHATKALSLQDNPFKQGTPEAKEWEDDFTGYQDCLLEQILP